jgi:hypothetical protein
MSTNYLPLFGAYDATSGALQGFATVGGSVTPLVPGSTTMAGLTDRTTYDLPTNNGPLAAALAAASTKFRFKTPAANNDYTGFTDQGLLASGSFTRWQVVGINGSGQLALASATNGILALGLLVADVASSAAGEYLNHGIARNDSWTWTPGAALWISPTTGGLTQTKPAATGNVQQPIGFARTASTIFINIGNAFNVTAL